MQGTGQGLAPMASPPTTRRPDRTAPDSRGEEASGRPPAAERLAVVDMVAGNRCGTEDRPREGS
ncbi:hypothetical protein GCM10010381_61510 [Streptomyces xantholiticus]|nr:hypothetical protein GCM10010381_61510 [Streptomyces xantholiticus]